MGRGRPGPLLAFVALSSAASVALAVLLKPGAPLDPGREPAVPKNEVPGDAKADTGHGTSPDSQSDPEATDDRTALARMLASETSDPGAQVVIGWITVQRARKRKVSLYRMITNGHGYGKQDRGSDGIFYASSAKQASAATLRLAVALLDGTVQPSALIRQTKPGSWVERAQGVNDGTIVKLQSRWQEGAWARLSSNDRPTKWILFSAEQPVQQLRANQSAAELLDELPAVEALDRSSFPGLGPLVA